jgi:tRNA (guanosine-2'-O-)-methyltransferase
MTPEQHTSVELALSEGKKPSRLRADAVKDLRCKNLIVVLEWPTDVTNIATVIRNVNALGVEKTYVVDPKKSLPDSWEEMKKRGSLSKPSVGAIRWSFVKRFDSTEACLAHLEKHRFVSVATSPHVKGRTNYVLHEADYTAARLAVWFGSEARGISDLAVEKSAFCVSIPMAGMVESLNLATATGIVLYEVVKQRRAFQEKYKRAIRRPRTVAVPTAR